MSTYWIVGLIVICSLCLVMLFGVLVEKVSDALKEKKYKKWVKNNGDAVGKYADAVIELFIEEGEPANPTYMTMEDNLAYINKNHDTYSDIIKAEIYREIRHCYSYKILTDENMSFEDTYKAGRILSYNRCAYYLSEAITYDYNEDKLNKARAEKEAREEAEKKRIDEKLFALMKD